MAFAHGRGSDGLSCADLPARWATAAPGLELSATPTPVSVATQLETFDALPGSAQSFASETESSITKDTKVSPSSSLDSTL